MSIQLEDIEQQQQLTNLNIGLDSGQHLWIELFGQKLVQPDATIVPDHWHKVTITKQQHNHKLSLKIDHHSEIFIHFEESFWPKISFAGDKLILFNSKIAYKPPR
jgi:hypothetical protein